MPCASPRRGADETCNYGVFAIGSFLTIDLDVSSSKLRVPTVLMTRRLARRYFRRGALFLRLRDQLFDVA
jgi:hypothetical protein